MLFIQKQPPIDAWLTGFISTRWLIRLQLAKTRILCQKRAPNPKGVRREADDSAEGREEEGGAVLRAWRHGAAKMSADIRRHTHTGTHTHARTHSHIGARTHTHTDAHHDANAHAEHSTENVIGPSASHYTTTVTDTGTDA